MIIGIVAEFNPLTSGHIYFINKIKELYNPDYLICAMSPNYTMRGDVSIFNKLDRTALALSYGVDIVAQIPTIYTIESADIYAYRSIEILNHLGITDLVFGAETDNIDDLYKILNIMKSNEYNILLKSFQKEGYSFNSSSKMAIEKIDPSSKDIISMPNNILGIEYLKAIDKINRNINPHIIKRVETNYFDDFDKTKSIQSASAIRKELILNNKSYLPYDSSNFKIHKLDDYFNLLKYKITSMSKEELKEIHLVNEGLENSIKDNITKSNDLNSLINSLVSKRNRETKIRRILLMILLNIKKSEVSTDPLKYIRILGFNKNASKYLKKIDFALITEIKSNLDISLYKELDYTKIYDLTYNENLDKLEYLPIII